MLVVKCIPLILVIFMVYGCSEESSSEDVALSDEGSSAAIFYENVGNSNRLLGCFAASQVISSDLPTTGITPQVDLGQTAAEVREIAGKPRHIYQSVWTFGYDLPVNVPGNPLWDLIPTATVVDIGTTAWSGDNFLCDGSEAQFIADANGLFAPGQSFGHTFEVPNCLTAARRIAARVELGMTRAQVRDAVGKPVEITVDGYWRYEYGAFLLQDPPTVQFGQSEAIFSPEDEAMLLDNEDTNDSFGNTATVIGYWSPENFCRS